MGLIAERYRAVAARASDAADAVGRNPGEISVVAVTKHVGVPEIEEALHAGILDMGENRVQDFEGKYGLFPQVRWHFIGHLQTNKVKQVVGKAHLIHSVDSAHLLETIERRAALAGVIQPVLLQVNVSGEESKSGFEPGEMADALEQAAACEHVSVRGLMTMAPFVSAEDVRWVFRELRELRDSLCANAPDGVELGELSMGMTNDFEIAIEEGATIVRVGRAIFGR